MKLNIVPARTGLLWVKQGMRAFFKQPIALSGLFFMFMAVISMCTILPWIGSVLALVLIPGATLGMMAASHEASRGRFPMPTILVTAFRAGHQQMRSMLVLGALYAAGFVGLLGLTALLDGGQFAQLYLVGGRISADLLNDERFLGAMWLFTLGYLPLSLLFWHAPALVHWDHVPPVKSLFFSLLAQQGCLHALRPGLDGRADHRPAAGQRGGRPAGPPDRQHPGDGGHAGAAGHVLCVAGVHLPRLLCAAGAGGRHQRLNTAQIRSR